MKKKTSSKSVTKKTAKPTSAKAKRPAKRKANRVVAKKQSSYNILQTAISSYCKERYEKLMANPMLSAEEKKKIRKTCTIAETSDIYKSLKARFIETKEKNLVLSPQEIAATIEQRLAFKDSDIGLRGTSP